MRLLLCATILFAVATTGRAGELWPQNEFAHVVAYCYDHSQDDRGSSIVQEDGTHHKGIISAVTLRLTKEQDKKLRRLLVPPKKHPGSADCFLPHHAFVFYDADWNVKAHFSICFLCGNFKAHPKNISQKLNLVGLKEFAKELGLPVYSGSGAPAKYTKLYQKLEHSERGSDQREVEAGEKTKPDSEARSK